ncbi:MAG: SNF2-related protein [Planctomycetota bacterium]
MTALSDLLALFSELPAFQRGAELMDQGAVFDVDPTPEGLHAVVGDRRVHHVLWQNSSHGLRAGCDCRESGANTICAHAWAALIEAEDFYDPRAVEASLGDLRKIVNKLGGRSSSWRHRLRPLLGDPGAGPPAPAIPTRWRVLLRADPHLPPGTASLTLWSSKPLKSGRHGAWRQADPHRALARGELGPLLTPLVEGIREAAPTWRGRSKDLAVGAAWCSMVLLRLAEGGWLHVGEQDELEAPAPRLASPRTARMALEPSASSADDGDARYTLDMRLANAEGQERSARDLRAVTPDGLLVFEDELCWLEPRSHARWVQALGLGREVTVPAAERGEVAVAIAQQVDAPPLTESSIACVDAKPVGLLELAASGPRPSGCRLAWSYEGVRVPLDGGPALVASADGKCLLRRDAAAEEQLLEASRAAGVRLVAPDWTEWPWDLPLEEAETRLEGLTLAGWRVTIGDHAVRTGGRLALRAKQSGTDWFDIEGHAHYDEHALALPALLEAVATGRSVLTLPDGTAALLPAAWRARLRALAGLAQGAEGRIAAVQAPLLDALASGVADLSADVAFGDRVKAWKQAAAPEPRDAPEGFRATLRPYQCEGLGWLAFLERAGLGGCLADDMGLGKTVQVLAHLHGRRTAKRKRPPPSLVVAPLSVVSGWVDQAHQFAPDLKTAVYHGAGRADVLGDLDAHDVIITTYGTLRRDADELAAHRFDHVILDEAQAIKNATSRTAAAARGLQADHRLALTGTPVENHLGDLHSLMQFLNPGLLGGAQQLDRVFGGAAPDAEGLDILQRAIRPIVLRRTKDQVLADLPEKSEQVVRCTLPKAQRKAYEELREHYRAKLLARVADVGLARSKIHVLEALLRLRQGACHLALLDAKHRDTPSAKLDMLLPQLEEIAEAGHKALVFSQFTSFLALVREQLDQRKIAYEYLDGRTRKRADKIRRFQEDAGISAFLISLKAGGTGLNLTAADYVFLLDPWWNPAVEAQAVDRAHRIGQTRKVMVYRLIGEDTVEDKVLELQVRKRALVSALLGGVANAPLRGISTEDLELLLG